MYGHGSRVNLFARNNRDSDSIVVTGGNRLVAELFGNKKVVETEENRPGETAEYEDSLKMAGNGFQRSLGALG